MTQLSVGGGGGGGEGAWVTLVMKGDAYIPGALALCESIKQKQSKFPVVCMYTDDVSPSGLSLLQIVFDQCILVSYVQANVGELYSPSQRNLYANWMSCSFTKWTCMSFVQYKKVCFLDADMIMVENSDDLFNLSAPAANFSHPMAIPFCNKGLANPYMNIQHGSLIPREAIEKGLAESFVAFGSVVLLPTSLEYFENFRTWITTKSKFGHPQCRSGHDEQSISEYFCFNNNNNIQWTMIDQRFNYIPWEDQWYTYLPIDNNKPRIYHYVAKKPWACHRSLFPDLEVWWKFADILSLRDSSSSSLLLKELFTKLQKTIDDVRANHKENVVAFMMRRPIASAAFFTYSTSQDALMLEEAFIGNNNWHVKWIRHFADNKVDAGALENKLRDAKMVLWFGNKPPGKEVVAAINIIKQTNDKQKFVWVPSPFSTTTTTITSMNNNTNNNNFDYVVAKSTVHADILVNKIGIRKECIWTLPWTTFLCTTTTTTTATTKHKVRPFSFLHFIGYSQHRFSEANIMAATMVMRDLSGITGKLHIKWTRTKYGALPFGQETHQFISTLDQQWKSSQRIVIESENFITAENKQQLLYANADIALCCSSGEDSGHILIEAAALGLIVVALDTPLHRELLCAAPFVVWCKECTANDIHKSIMLYLEKNKLVSPETILGNSSETLSFRREARMASGQSWFRSSKQNIQSKLGEKLA